jgi:beta-aspartyl-peptidase (threonine type)
MTASQRAGLGEALRAGHEVLDRGGPALEAIETAVRVLEASGLFNAGVGSRLQLDGTRRMDASIMEGRELRAGAVAGIEQVRHPITAARLVLEETGHVLLAGEPASRFARYFKLERQPAPTAAQLRALRAEVKAKGTPASWRTTLRLYDAMWRAGTGKDDARELGTVGAVALDQEGTVAAGASTGGIALMLPGRVGDTPLIGCGVYADNEAGAVSMTGLGEGIIRLAVAKEIADRLASGSGPATAARLVLARLGRVQGAAGALVLAKDGRFAIRHTTLRMAVGYWNGVGKPVVADRFM